MKGQEDFISSTTTTTRLTKFRNKEPAVRIQGRGCTPPPTARALLGTPTGGHYPDPNYQHEGYHRLSPHAKSSVQIDPGTEVRNEEQPEKRPTSLGPNQPHCGATRWVPHNPVTRIRENPEGSYGMMTEKLRALPDTLTSSG